MNLVLPKNDRVLLSLALVLLALPMLVACSSPITTEPAASPSPTLTASPTPTSPPTDTPTPSPTPTEEPTPTPVPCAPASAGPLSGVDPRGQTVIWWHHYYESREERLKQLVDNFNTTNVCGITVVPENQGRYYSDLRDKMEEALSTSDAVTGVLSASLPSLLLGYQHDQAYYARAGLLVDVNRFIDDPRWGLLPEEKADFYPALLAQGVHRALEGQRLGFPLNRAMELLYYNKTWLAELGYSEAPTTPQAFRAMACAGAATNADGTGGYILRTDASALAAWSFAFGGNVVSADGSGYVYNSDATIEAVTFLRDLYTEGCAYFFTDGYPNPELASRRALFTQGSSAGIPYYQMDFENAGSGDVFGVVAIPHTTVAPVQNVYGADISILSASPEADLAAWIFLKWFTEAEQQAQWVKITNYFPTRASTFTYLDDYIDENPQWGTALDLLDYGAHEPQFVSYSTVRGAVYGAMMDIFEGAAITETLTALTERVNALQQEMVE